MPATLTLIICHSFCRREEGEGGVGVGREVVRQRKGRVGLV